MRIPASPFTFGNKPSGVTTHQSSPDKPGYQEWLENRLQSPLLTIHRLDKETSGAMIFAHIREDAQKLAEEFSNHRVIKEYIFITDRPPAQRQWTHSSRLPSKSGSQTVESVTDFLVLQQHKQFSVILAKPKTGKTHQIRIHAMECGIPLLGDSLYRGSPFPHFYLHCRRLHFPELAIDHSCPEPLIFSHLSLLENPLLCQWLTSIDRRERLYPELQKTALRWIHDEGTPLRIDHFYGMCVAGWWNAEPPTDIEKNTLKQLMAIKKIPHWILLHYSGKRDYDHILLDHNAPATWTTTEAPLHFHMRKESGLSCGLFLDQRENRHWLYRHSQNKHVLNLFSYTGGFSVASAKGGAQQVTTVDLNKNYLEWSKENFVLNDIPIENHLFYAMDSFEFLKYAQRKEKTYDIIICDPPSFSRNKKGTLFRIDKDFPTLLSACFSVLRKEGILIFCTNYEKWTAPEWQQQLERELRSENIEITHKLRFNWDYETDHNRHMKTFFLVKK